jgi:hypothetical protein
VTERKANLDGAQTILQKLRWYQGIAGYLFQNFEEQLSILRQRELLREKMIDYFTKSEAYCYCTPIVFSRPFMEQRSLTTGIDI